ncbi:hypothetical protein Zmor_003239 [Zophobas morio]|uniref:Uncharacterized protein n=1 Tax=Zophobas morio TaxID=2755281 RepID=A0AA38HLE4_9CUCU|nr:hypothetical protein Zmor_003239 [Zophobas morio]
MTAICIRATPDRRTLESEPPPMGSSKALNTENHSAHYGIVFIDGNEAAAFEDSLENRCQTNIDPDTWISSKKPQKIFERKNQTTTN